MSSVFDGEGDVGDNALLRLNSQDTEDDLQMPVQYVGRWMDRYCTRALNQLPIEVLKPSLYGKGVGSNLTSQ